ncbi:MAG: OmpA family protein [Candidatus Kapaibacterium sp.]
MKVLTTFLIALFFGFSSTFAQFGLGEKLKRKVEEKIEEKTEEAIEKALEKPFEEGEEEEEEENESKENAAESPKNEENDATGGVTEPTMKTYSKFDFTAGENLLFFEDFSQDPVGDFPVNWNTNGSGEVVTATGYEGKWLKVSDDALYVPDINHSFPENFTVEFDLLCNFPNPDEKDHFGYFRLEILRMDNTGNSVRDSYINADGILYNIVYEMDLQFKYDSRFWITNVENGAEAGIKNEQSGKWIKGWHRKPIHFSISVNKQRFRIWVNQNKVFDIPRLAKINAAYNVIRFQLSSVDTELDYDVLLTNVKLAGGVSDARSKLLNEGKFVTTGITFDSGSDKIKPESFAVIKSIAEVLTANPNVQINIIGHTDSDGNARDNQLLSVKRALSVKNSLVNDFSISEARIQTSGKGDTEPVAENSSSAGKAQNRRVEFVKL